MAKRGMAAAAVIYALLVPGLVSTASAGTEAVCVEGNLEGILSVGGRLQDDSVRKARAVPAEYDENYDMEIINAIESLRTEIPVEGAGITKDNVTEIINRIWNTNPQLFYLKKWEYSYYPSTGEVRSLLFTYTGTEEEILHQKEEISAVLAEAEEAVDAERMTEEEIALAMHDYLASHVKYAYEDYLEGTVDFPAYNIYGALVEGEAVCQGYALAYEYLLNLYDISGGIASSNAANHAWNVVEIGGEWYHVDVTWDDPAYDNLGRALHSVFLVSTNAILAIDAARSDYVAITPSGCPYVEATDLSFEEGFWRDSSAVMYYYEGHWYYSDRTSFEIVKYDYAAQQKEVLMQLNVRWPDWENPSYWMVDNFCRIARIKETLYYSTPDAVYALPLGGGEKTPVFSADTSGGYICGLGVSGGKLLYVQKKEAPGDEPESALEILLPGAEPGDPEEPDVSEEPNVPEEPGVPKEPEALQPAPPIKETGQPESEEKTEDVTVSVARQSIRSLKSRKSRRLTVTWKKDTYADGYQICCSTSKSFASGKTRIIRIRNKKRIQYTIKKLKSKTKYYVRVRSYKMVGSVCYYGNYSKRKAIKVK